MIFHTIMFHSYGRHPLNFPYVRIRFKHIRHPSITWITSAHPFHIPKSYPSEQSSLVFTSPPFSPFLDLAMLIPSILFFLGLAAASPVDLLEDRQTSCPGIHVFGARETTVSQGYGTSSVVVNAVLAAYSGSTSEAIVYPACGGQASCGSISYANSVLQGVAAVKSQVNAFNTKCPSTQLVIVGYSQGGQIFDDAFCGGGDTNEGLSDTSVQIQASAVAMIKAAIWMGNPRFISGLSYQVGTCKAQGVRSLPPLLPSMFPIILTRENSSHRVQQASSALQQLKSSPTATQQTHTAATALTQRRTRATAQSTVLWR